MKRTEWKGVKMQIQKSSEVTRAFWTDYVSISRIILVTLDLTDRNSIVSGLI